MQPLHMVFNHLMIKEDNDFPLELVDFLVNMIKKDITPRDLVTREFIRNAMIVSMAVGGSTNVLLHGPEIARAAGYKVLMMT